MRAAPSRTQHPAFRAKKCEAMARYTCILLGRPMRHGWVMTQDMKFSRTWVAVEKPTRAEIMDPKRGDGELFSLSIGAR